MKRLSVEMVREAAESTGLSLRSRITLDTDARCGCPIGIMAAQAKGELLQQRRYFLVDELAKIVGIDPDYATGFVNAFDGRGYCPVSEVDSMGCLDGQTIRRELFDVN